MMAEQNLSYLPLAFYFLLVLIVIAGMLGLSFVLGQRHTDRATNEPYESGVLITGTARIRFSAKFYLVAMFFVVFDLEAVFLYAWSTSVRELGWAGFIQVFIFICILLASLIYIWRTGGLNIGPSLRQIQESKETEEI